MRPPILVGIILAAATIALGFFAPYIGTSDARATWRAQQQAELARRDLARVSVDSARLASVVDAPTLKSDSAAFERAAASGADQLRKQAAEAQKSIGRAQQLAREAGLAAPELAAPAPSAAGLQRALGQFEQALKSDAALLDQAIATAKSGRDEKSDAIGVEFAVGIGEYIKAVGDLVDAEVLRTAQLAAQARLIGLAANWKQVRATIDQFKGFQTAPVMERLREDLAEFAKLRTDADAAVTTVQAQVAEREQGLARVDTDLKAARSALLEHERQGFRPGDDASFLAFRSKYAELSNRLKELQEEEHELRFGGHVGEGLTGLDQPGAPVEGGREVVPLSILKAQLDRAAERAKHLSTAHIEIENQIKYLGELAQRAQTEAQRHETRLAALVTEQQEAAAKVSELAAAALAKEGTAMRSATSAVSAFSKSQQALSTWVRDARETQQNLDPERRNERLNLLLKDQYLEQIGSTAESAARILAGRVAALQVESGARAVADIQTLTELNPEMGAAVDLAAFEKLVETARQSGIETLDKARQLLEKASAGPATTSWAPLGMLAAAQHLTARIDTSRADALRAEALATIEKAVDKRDQSPYLASLVEFRDHLRGGAPAPSETPAPPRADPNAPAAPAAPTTPAAP